MANKKQIAANQKEFDKAHLPLSQRKEQKRLAACLERLLDATGLVKSYGTSTGNPGQQFKTKHDDQHGITPEG